MLLKRIYPNNAAELNYNTQTKEYVLLSKFNTESGQYEEKSICKNPLEAVNSYLSKIELDAQKRLLKAFTDEELGITENETEGENNATSL